MKRTKDEIDNFFDNTKCYTANDYFYKYGRQRNHNGKANAELFLANVFILSPLMDPILYRLSQNIGKDNDNDLLYAIIYNRYLPEIDELGFDSNRIVLEKTKCIAAEINKKYPIKTTYVESKALPILYRRECPGKSNNGHNSLDYLKDAFYSGEVKEFCKKFYGEEIYVKADEYYKKREYHPYIAGAGLVESYVIWKASQISNEVNYWAENQTPNRLDSYEEPLNYYNNGIMNEILDYLKSGRIDIQKKGTEKSDIIILESSDPNLYIEKVKDGESGNGYILQSCKCQLTLKIAVKESGTLSVFLKGPWMRDSSNCPLPIKIDFLKLLIRDDKGVELIAIKDITTVDSSKTQMVECKVANNKKYYIYAEWTAHAYSNAEISKLITEMSKIRIDRYLFWKH